jgi:hypothetical protein
MLYQDLEALMLNNLYDLEYSLKHCQNKAHPTNYYHSPECEPRSRVALILP